VLPPKTKLKQNNTHRLIPSRYVDGDETVLRRLSDSRRDLSDLFVLEGATNSRLQGEAGLLPGISVRELVFGLSYSHIVNAAFTHANPTGSRFNGPDRGAWYAGFSRKTSETEVAYHRAQELKEIGWMEKEVFTYVDFLADFRGEFHDLRETNDFASCLDPSSYEASQRLAGELLEAGSAGVVYPSVRHTGGVCLCCFRPALVNNVRKTARLALTFENALAKPVIETL
jgi:RES domain